MEGATLAPADFRGENLSGRIFARGKGVLRGAGVMRTEGRRECWDFLVRLGTAK